MASDIFQRYISPQGLKAGSQGNVCSPLLTEALFIIAKRQKKPSAHQSVNAQNVVYTDSRPVLSLRRRDIGKPATIQTDREDALLGEISQPQKDRHYTTPLP